MLYKSPVFEYELYQAESQISKQYSQGRTNDDIKQPVTVFRMRVNPVTIAAAYATNPTQYPLNPYSLYNRVAAINAAAVCPEGKEK